MVSLKSAVKSKGPGAAAVSHVREIGGRIPTEFVLNKAISALAQAGITPMYEDYMSDPRLSDEDRDELARAYLLLQMASAQATGNG